MDRSRVLIIGATGNLGYHLAKASIDASHPTFALVRDSAFDDPRKSQKIRSLSDAGAVILKGSLEDEKRLVEALKQVDVVICAIPSKQALAQQNLIRAIKLAGSIKFFCWVEIESVLDEEPWIFDKSVMALKEITDQIIRHGTIMLLQKAMDFDYQYSKAQDKGRPFAEGWAISSRLVTASNRCFYKLTVDSFAGSEGWGSRDENAKVITSAYSFVENGWNLKTVEGGTVRCGMNLYMRWVCMKLAHDMRWACIVSWWTWTASEHLPRRKALTVTPEL
ncbi:hypothetical protein Cgig2_020138 [Carnegiea gigantea]|uniref:NmrA-like domain-containing protein n=1 Tax=Carnegiea gigantea TaxID=171969 RepID=A0A9Q1KFP6_9CARY|nr:hypothetical protein Cgig2_020138 [Carnegiea gigantea]